MWVSSLDASKGKILAVKTFEGVWLKATTTEAVKKWALEDAREERARRAKEARDNHPSAETALAYYRPTRSKALTRSACLRDCMLSASLRRNRRRRRASSGSTA